MLPCIRESHWLNYLVSNALSLGAAPGDVGDAIAPACALLGAGVDQHDPAVIEAWHSGWAAVGSRIERQAQADSAHGHLLSAGEKYLRASLMFMQAEAQLPSDDDRKRDCFIRGRTAFRHALNLMAVDHTFVSLSHRGGEIDALFIAPDGPGPHPALVFYNGFHTTMEWYYLCGIVAKLNRRGIACLLMDQPGSGSAYLVNGLPIEWDTEVLGGKALDYLAGRDDVDTTAIGVIGSSFGGYFAPRAAAHDPRFALCIVWGAAYAMKDHPIAEVAARARTGALDPRDRDMLDEWMRRVGAADLAAFDNFLDQVNPGEEAARIRAPVLIVHGEDDALTPPHHARDLAQRARHSRAVTLRIITGDEGGSQHCQLDNMPMTIELIADWAADTFEIKGTRS